MTTRVLQVVTDTDRRGAQVFASDLDAALARRGIDVRTVALAPGRVGGLDLPVLGPSRRSLATLRALRREIQGVDVVVGHGSTTLPLGAIVTFGTGTPFVYRQISDSRFWAPSGLRRLRVRLAMRRCDAIVALWSGAAVTLREHFGVDRARIHVVPNGVPSDEHRPTPLPERASARRALGLDPDRPTLLAIGALVPEKGVDLVVRTLVGVPGAQLIVAGDGPERRSLETLARTVAADRVVFTGLVGNTGDAYAAADLVVLASRGGDSMPAVLIEAGLRALPAVSTDVAAIPEVVLNGVTGRVVPVDDPGALNEAVRSLVESPASRESFGAAAREWCLGRYDIEVVAAQWARVLDDVTGAR